MKQYLSPPKAVGLMHRCKRCKTAVRTTVQIEGRTVDNEHPEWYLRKVTSYRRLVGSQGWVESHYFRFPRVPCPSCGMPLDGKPIEGRYIPDHPCDARCTGAKGHSCECSCGGKNHGADHAAKL